MTILPAHLLCLKIEKKFSEFISYDTEQLSAIISVVTVQYLLIRAVKPDVLNVFVWNYIFLFSLSFPGAWMLVVQAVFLHTSIWGESSCHM